MYKKVNTMKKSKSYICNKGFEEEVINEMLDILRNDEKFLRIFETNNEKNHNRRNIENNVKSN